MMRKLWWLLTSRRPTAEEIEEFNLPQPEDMQAFCDGMGDPYKDGLIERDLAIRERLAALWELAFPRADQMTTLWGVLRFAWYEWRGPIIASAIFLALTVGLLLMQARL